MYKKHGKYVARWSDAPALVYRRLPDLSFTHCVPSVRAFVILPSGHERSGSAALLP
jgi:hypothetical protein